MDDPWDVKSVRPAGLYTSCMKLNGTPLLPPVLSKECRKEMQYYKLLAKEVEKRISTLKPYVEEVDVEPPKTENPAAELEDIITAVEDSQELLDITKKLKTLNNASLDIELPTSDFFELSSPNVVNTTEASSKFVIDFSISINQTATRNITDTNRVSPTLVYPERDYHCLREKELLTDVETTGKHRPQQRTKASKKDESAKDDIIEDTADMVKNKVLQDIEGYRNAIQDADTDIENNGPQRNNVNANELDDSDSCLCMTKVKDDFSEPCMNSITSLDPCISLSSKSFTGSLNNLHTESLKECDTILNLTRQRSYTILNPSPQLLAHLEEQTLTTGVAMKNISMSESMSSLCNFNNKKRRSWDLESAKVKWSSMAMELKAKNLPNSNTTVLRPVKQIPKSTTLSNSPSSKNKPASLSKNKRVTPTKCVTKSEPITKRKPTPSHEYPSNTTITIDRSLEQKIILPLSKSPPPVVPEIENPGQKVRELYEKIKMQQIAQMNSLVEKQRREQMLLQQVFEEQNSILYKQLKTIVPKGAIEAKEAWGDKIEAERGPVSLSQLINHKRDHQIQTTKNPITSPHIDTHNYISKCDNALQKSRDISDSLRKTRISSSNSKNQSPKVSGRDSPVRTNMSPTRRAATHSPNRSNGTSSRATPKNPQNLTTPCRTTSRRLNYDTSTDPYDPILTDRTNDTLADLNVTFPTDKSDTESSRSSSSSQSNDLKLTIYHSSSLTQKTGSDIFCVEDRNRNLTGVRRPESSRKHSPPTPKQLAAAAKIVAYAKGFLVRRLMKTERVVATVQTIRDALLCALQMHQDREGILGADVDLHRRLIQQITAACYSLHDTFITSTPEERCALLAADRARRRAKLARPPSFSKSTDL